MSGTPFDNSLNLETVGMRNFMSYGNNTTVVDLQRPGTTLIVGEDVESGISNGSGKTTILNAIVYAIFDRPISKELKLDELINNVNKKNMEVFIKFNKAGRQYEIRRYRKGKDGNGVKLFIDGVDSTRDSVDRTNQYIAENIIGYSYDLFVRIVVFSAGHEPFFSLPTSGAKKPTQSEIIEELFSITVLAQKATLLKEDIKDNERKLELMKVRVDQIDKEKDRHEKLITSTEAKLVDWDDNQDLRIISTQKQLKQANNTDYKTEEIAHKQIVSLSAIISNVTSTMRRVEEWEDLQTSKIQMIQNRMKSLEGIDFDKQEALFVELDLHKAELKDQSTALQIVMAKLKTDTASMKKMMTDHSALSDQKCPYCLQDYVEAKAKADELQINIDLLTKSIEDAADTRVTIEDRVTAAKTAVEVISNQTVSDLKSLLIMKNDADTLAERLNDLQNDTNPHLPVLKDLVGDSKDLIASAQKLIKDSTTDLELYKSQVTTKSLDELMSLKSSCAVLQSKMEAMLEEINPHVAMLRDLKRVALDSPQYDEINELQKLVEHQKFLVKLLTKNDSFVRKSIIDKNIPLLNQRLKKNLTDLGLPHKVEFTNTMTASISQLGRSISYHGLSAGQQARINLALSFAFRDVLQKMHSPINFCLLDEVLDVGLCTHGIAAAVRMLKHKAKDEKMTMFVISHKMGEDSGFESTLKVEFKGGFSGIQQ